MAKWIDKILGIDKLRERQTERVELLSSGTASFTAFSGSAYESDVFRAAVDAIARNAAKLRGKHIIYSKTDSKRLQGDQALNRVLNTRPNPYMTSYDLIYKLVTHYYLHNNAFAYLQKDDSGNLRGIYPLSPNNVEYVIDGNNEMYLQFLFGNGQQVTLHMSEVFIARRHFNSNDLLGDSNSSIMTALELAHNQNQGLSESIKSSATIRGILKYNQVLSPEKMKQEKDAFMADYLSMSNHGGIAAVDSKMDYEPLAVSNISIDDGQINAVKKKIYEYLGISENIVNSTYTEDEWAAFYESIIEPLAIQFSLELTDKIFTEREQAFGNTIIFEAGRLQFASNESKTNIIKELMPLGILTANQALEILNMPPVADGDKRLQTLNVVNSEIADQYQMGRNKTYTEEEKYSEGNQTRRDQSATE
ncbi:phage portal protein [Salinicoccus sp. Marseille-QA3877]